MTLQHPRKDLKFKLDKPDSASLDYDLNRILKDKYGELSDFDRLEYDELVVVDKDDGFKLSVPKKNILNNNQTTKQTKDDDKPAYLGDDIPFIVGLFVVVLMFIIVCLVIVSAFDIGNDRPLIDRGDPLRPNADVVIEKSNGEIKATLIANQNVDYIYLSQDGNKWGSDPDSSNVQDGLVYTGDDLYTARNSEAGNDVGINTNSSVKVIAVMPDDSEKILKGYHP